MNVSGGRFPGAKRVQEKLPMRNFREPAFLNGTVGISELRRDDLVRKSREVALQGFQRSGWDAGIVVQDQDGIERSLGFLGERYSQVVGGSEPEIPFWAAKRHFGKFFHDPLRRSVRAAVIDDENLEAVRGLPGQVPKAVPGLFPLSVGDEDDGGSPDGFHVFFQILLASGNPTQENRTCRMRLLMLPGGKSWSRCRKIHGKKRIERCSVCLAR